MSTEPITPAVSPPPAKKRSLVSKILLVLVLLFVGLLVVIAVQSNEFRISRSLAMKASPETVFEHVNDFHKWDWNPWGKIDPNMKISYAGPEQGPTSSYHWVGNAEVGEGKMTILESKPGEFVKVKLEFLKPMPGVSTAEFTFKPEKEQTLVTWSMFGPKNFIAKAFHLFMDMDGMIGSQFEKGLQDMKKIVEAEPKKT